MSDDWGDDGGGWGEEGDGEDAGWGDDGGDDAGWGDDDAGGNDDSGWGNAEFEDADAAMHVGDDDLSIDDKISNAMFEVEEALEGTDVDRQLTLYEQVVELSVDQDLNADSKVSVYKALAGMVPLLYRQNNMPAVLSAYERALLYVPNISRDEAAKEINSVLDLVSTADYATSAQLYEATRIGLSKIDGMDRLMVAVNLRQCSDLYKNGDLKTAMEIADQIHSSCKLADGSDDRSKGSDLWGVYAIKIKIAYAHGDDSLIRELAACTKTLSGVLQVKDPRSNSVIKECWARVAGDVGNWNEAYSLFYQSFSDYVESHLTQESRRSLRYLILSNLMIGGEHNPFVTPEAKALQDDEQIKPFSQLRNAFEKNSVKDFNSAIQQIQAQNDAYVDRHLAGMVWDFQSKAVVQFLKSYQRVHLSYLAEKMNVDTERIQALLVQLILDGRIYGTIDQINDLVDMSGGGKEGADKYDALINWTNYVQSLENRMPQPYSQMRETGRKKPMGDFDIPF